MLPTSIFLIPMLCAFHLTICQQLENHLIADPNGVYHIFWTVEDDSVTFELQVKTKGYIGFGFSPNGGMVGADVIIGWVLPNGTAIFHDRHAFEFSEPDIDINQNYELVKAFENETHTTLRFKRKLVTCDKDDRDITDNTLKLIFSWHPDDPKGETGLPYHGKSNRGTKSVLLLSAQPQMQLDSTDDVIIWDVQAPNVTITTKVTTYWCFTVKLPEFQEPHDYIGFSMHITPGLENIVHHFALMECRGENPHFKEQFANTAGYECMFEGALAEPMECQPPMVIWTVGSQGQRFPKDVGIPVGEKFGGATYFLMNVHYTNVERKAGLVDNTIAHVYLSKKPRKIQAAILQVYVNVDYTLTIPPNQPEFTVTAYCPSECTKHALPETGINVFAVGLHSHFAGRKISVRHFRGDQELKPITADNSYDFNYQEIRQLITPVTILPGDMLMASCTYSSTNKNRTTPGGYGTSQEMCAVYMSYYPAVPLSLCIGGPTQKEIAEYYGVEIGPDMLHITSPKQYQNQSMFDYLEKYDWTSVSEEKLKKMSFMQKEGDHTVVCQDVPATKEGTKIVTAKYPSNATFYVEPDQCSTYNAKGGSSKVESTSGSYVKEEKKPTHKYSQIQTPKPYY